MRGARRGSARWLLAALLVVAAGLFMFLARARESKEAPSSESEMQTAAPPRAADQLERPLASSDRGPVASGTPSDARSRLEQFRTRLESVASVAGAWSVQTEGDFREWDLRELREAVRELEVSPTELRAWFHASDSNDELRPVLLAAFAFARNVSEDDKRALAKLVADGGPSQPSEASIENRVRQRSRLAGVFALGMCDAQAQLDDLAAQWIPLGASAAPDSWQVRQVAVLAMNGLDSAGPATLAALREAVRAEPMNWTSACWRALARTGDAGDRAWLVSEAAAGAGHAREGLEHTRDPAMAAELERIASSAAPRDAYSAYMTASAARGLLSIGTRESFEAFERLVNSQNARVADFAWRAIEMDPPPESAGRLLQLAASLASGDAGYAPHPIHAAVDETCERLRRHNLSPERVRACASGATRALPGLVAAPDTLRRALEIVALGGSATEREQALEYVHAIAESEREGVRQALLRRD